LYFFSLRYLLIFTLPLCLLFPLGAVASESLFSYGQRPGIWTTDETILTGTVLTAAVGLSFLDESVHQRFQNSRTEGWDNISDAITTVGHPLTTLGISAVLWGLGQQHNNEYLAETGNLAFRAVALSQVGALTGKVLFGRARPGTAGDAYSFKPLSLDADDQSLPSAHTASAFALAAVLAKRSTTQYSPYIYYGLAALVGLSRIEQDKHWMSDVVMGALVGELSARVVLNWNLNKKTSLTVIPLVDRGFAFRVGLTW